jgi:hypothetical protein
MQATFGKKRPVRNEKVRYRRAAIKRNDMAPALRQPSYFQVETSARMTYKRGPEAQSIAFDRQLASYFFPATFCRHPPRRIGFSL